MNVPALYSQKPIWQRAFVIFAGPVMSLFFGYFIFCVMGMTIGLPGKPSTSTNQVVVFPNFDSSDDPTPAHTAGLRTGDRIVSINGIPTPNGQSLRDEIHKQAGEPIELMALRGSQTLHFKMVPKRTEYFDVNEKGKRIK